MRLRFTLFDARTSRPSIWEVSADGGNLHKVNLNLPEPDESYGGGWSTDGRYFFFNSTRDGTHSVWVIRDGGRRWLRGSAKPVQLTFSPDSYGGLITSEDPRRFFAWSGSEQLETARYYPDSGRVEPLLPGTHARQVIPSPDGAWLTYAVGGELWRSRPDGTMRQALVSGFSTINQIVWSPNAARILFHAVDSGKKEGFFTVSTAGGALTEAALGSGHNEAGWTDDGRGIVFAKWPAEGQVTLEQSGIFVFDLRNSRITRIPGSEGLVHPMFSPDGRFLAAITNFDSNPSQPTRVMLYDSRTQIWKEIGHGALVNPAQWSKDSKSFYYQDILSEGQRSFRYSTAANKTEAFVDFEGLLRAGYVRCSFLGISGDGSLLMSLRRNEVNIFRLDMDLP